jgi:hypothetical protein
MPRGISVKQILIGQTFLESRKSSLEKTASVNIGRLPKKKGTGKPLIWGH